jgi:hypothetical protein
MPGIRRKKRTACAPKGFTARGGIPIVGEPPSTRNHPCFATPVCRIALAVGSRVAVTAAPRAHPKQGRPVPPPPPSAGQPVGSQGKDRPREGANIQQVTPGWRRSGSVTKIGGHGGAKTPSAPPARVRPSPAQGRPRRRPNLCQKTPSLPARWLRPGRMAISIARRAKAAPSPRERRPVALQLFLNDPPTPPRRALVEEARPAARTCRP